MSISRYQQDRWLAVLENNIDHVMLTNLSGGTVSASVSAVFARRGLVLTNLTVVSLTGAAAAFLALQQGSTTLVKLPWTGGVAPIGSLVYSLGAA